MGPQVPGLSALSLLSTRLEFKFSEVEVCTDLLIWGRKTDRNEQKKNKSVIFWSLYFFKKKSIF